MTEFVYKGEDFDEKVRKQVEFYFSDSNLQQDKFLWKIYESNDGWVELKTILTFGRMKQYRPEERVIDALKKSEKLLLSSNNDMIKRKDPLKDINEVKSTKKKNTVHIEGFPHQLTQDEVEKWFNEKILPFLPKEKKLCSIRMIKTRAKKEFFGVVDVELSTEEDAQYLVKNVELSFEKGILSSEESQEVDKKDLLKKMSLLTFQEMRESGKRFGQNEVTKRRNSFNENKAKKLQKGNKGKKVYEKRKEEVKEGDKLEKPLEKVKEEGGEKEESKQDAAIKESKQDDAKESKQDDAKESKQDDAKESKQDDAKESKQDDAKESKQDDAKESKQDAATKESKQDDATKESAPEQD
ncbi:hypothetical protein KGF56_001466 [Candida oxycetoniae]|uniref:HTH La-type RNA-binding domain-containing protein n=1 Tax=Candida oxycetoniae TaxID=497107 RepID=A0AAI9WZA8_9ASCO|nr:uncharacterized protein KGF56_001466 [Candida oxycetoniae]KAI3405859.1 hypothetical protein KGF56_001466 [Candida oxycetoniae]